MFVRVIIVRSAGFGLLTRILEFFFAQRRNHKFEIELKSNGYGIIVDGM